MPATDQAARVRLERGEVSVGVRRLAGGVAAFGCLVGLCGFLALIDTPGHVAVEATGMGLFGVAIALAAPLLKRLGARERSGRGESAELVVGGTSVRVGSTTLYESDVVAAAVVREEPPLLVLACAGDPLPLFLTFERAFDLEQVRQVLGIGHRGRGVLRLALPQAEATRRAGEWVQLLRTALAVALVALSFTEAAPLLLVLTLWSVLPVLLLLSAWTSPSGASVELGPAGMVQRRLLRRQSVLYAQIDRVVERAEPTTSADRVALEVRRKDEAPPLRLVLGAGTLALRTVRSVLHACVEARVFDRSTARDDARWAALRRQTVAPDREEDSSAWIARLDTLAIAADGAAGYRSAVLEPDALRSALEDPAADLDLRCAAARLLARAVPRQLDETLASLAVSEPAVRARVDALLDPSPTSSAGERALSPAERLPPQRW